MVNNSFLMSPISNVCKVKKVRTLNYTEIRKIFYCSAHKESLVKINVQQIGMQQVFNSSLQPLFVLLIFVLPYFCLKVHTKEQNATSSLSNTNCEH